MTRVLIVDDQEETLHDLQALLTGHGHEVDLARHGAEALVKARQKRPDLIVSDLLMPVMDGYTLLRHWKTDAHLRNIPFIVYTAPYAEAEDEKLAVHLGADAFILKPAEPADFMARVRAVQVPAAHASAVPAPLKSANGPPEELLKLYSETLIRKLEEKTLQLAGANRALQQDIIRRQGIEDELREREERFRATFEQAALGIAHVKLDGTFLRVNQRLCQITGYSEEELLRRTCLDLNAPEDRPEAAAVLRAMITDGQKSSSWEKPYRRPDGSVCWVHVVTTLLLAASGEPKYLITVVDDVTERKLLEEKFFRAQRLESIGTLAGGIAHDLNNILAPIVMGVDLLKITATDAMAQAVIQTISGSAQRGRDIVKQVLSFARGVEGARVAVHLGHVILEVEDIILTTFPKSIACHTHIPKDLWLVRGDPTQLNQVLLNLCVNARDAMSGGGELTLAARNIEIDSQYAILHGNIRAGNYVVVEVRDTGCGIPPEVQNRIFEPFFTHKGAGQGTGIELPTVQGIVRSHGGFVDVESVVGHGSTFRIHLPAHGETPRTDGTTAPLRPPRRGRGETILVVDDDFAVRDITQRTLEAFGYRVLAAEDGSEAIGLYAFNRTTIALVITDLMMPNMDGASLAVALRRITPQLPIIATTGVEGNAHAARAVAAGIEHVLAKPYSAEFLLEKVNTLLASP